MTSKSCTTAGSISANAAASFTSAYASHGHSHNSPMPLTPTPTASSAGSSITTSPQAQVQAATRYSATSSIIVRHPVPTPSINSSSSPRILHVDLTSPPPSHPHSRGDRGEEKQRRSPHSRPRSASAGAGDGVKAYTANNTPSSPSPSASTLARASIASIPALPPSAGSSSAGAGVEASALASAAINSVLEDLHRQRLDENAGGVAVCSLSHEHDDQPRRKSEQDAVFGRGVCGLDVVGKQRSFSEDVGMSAGMGRRVSVASGAGDQNQQQQTVHQAQARTQSHLDRAGAGSGGQVRVDRSSHHQLRQQQQRQDRPPPPPQQQQQQQHYSTSAPGVGGGSAHTHTDLLHVQHIPSLEERFSTPFVPSGLPALPPPPTHPHYQDHPHAGLFTAQSFYDPASGLPVYDYDQHSAAARYGEFNPALFMGGPPGQLYPPPPPHAQGLMDGLVGMPPPPPPPGLGPELFMHPHPQDGLFMPPLEVFPGMPPFDPGFYPGGPVPGMPPPPFLDPMVGGGGFGVADGQMMQVEDEGGRDRRGLGRDVGKSSRKEGYSRRDGGERGEGKYPSRRGTVGTPSPFSARLRERERDPFDPDSSSEAHQRYSSSEAHHRYSASGLRTSFLHPRNRLHAGPLHPSRSEAGSYSPTGSSSAGALAPGVIPERNQVGVFVLHFICDRCPSSRVFHSVFFLRLLYLSSYL